MGATHSSLVGKYNAMVSSEKFIPIHDAVDVVARLCDGVASNKMYNETMMPSGFVHEELTIPHVEDYDEFCRALLNSRDYFGEVSLLGNGCHGRLARVVITFHDVAKRCFGCKHMRLTNPYCGKIALVCGLVSYEQKEWGDGMWEAAIPPDTCDRSENK